MGVAGGRPAVGEGHILQTFPRNDLPLGQLISGYHNWLVLASGGVVSLLVAGNPEEGASEATGLRG
jgi:hypothetical protein